MHKTLTYINKTFCVMAKLKKKLSYLCYGS